MEPPKAKITITLGADVVAHVRAAVNEGRARSVSVYIEHAVAGQLAAEADFDSVISEMLASTGGPPTSEELLLARRLLSNPTP